jgi:hypothetical protein
MVTRQEYSRRARRSEDSGACAQGTLRPLALELAERVLLLRNSQATPVHLGHEQSTAVDGDPSWQDISTSRRALGFNTIWGERWWTLLVAVTQTD